MYMNQMLSIIHESNTINHTCDYIYFMQTVFDSTYKQQLVIFILSLEEMVRT